MLRMVVVGAGAAGTRHAQAARAVPGVRLSGVYDTDTGKAAELGLKMRTTSFPDFESALEEADFGVICTPPFTHGRLAKAALSAGVPVLVEKPFELDLELLGNLAALAKTKGLPLGAVAQHRFAPAVQTLRERLTRGELGNPESCHIGVQRHRPAAFFDARSWKQDKRMAGGGALLTVGFHYVDLACWLLGKPENPSAVAEKVINGLDAEITGFFTCRGTQCHFDVRWGDLENQDDRLQIRGAKKTLEILGDRWPGQPLSASRSALCTRQLEDFAQAIRERRPPAVNAEDVLPALQLIQQVYRAVGI